MKKSTSSCTRPYDGIIETLDELRAQGIRLAIVSNKIDFAVKALSKDYFGDRMISAVGDDPSRRKKPAPDSVLEAMRQMNVSAQESIYSSFVQKSISLCVSFPMFPAISAGFCLSL